MCKDRTTSSRRGSATRPSPRLSTGCSRWPSRFSGSRTARTACPALPSPRSATRMSATRFGTTTPSTPRTITSSAATRPRTRRAVWTGSGGTRLAPSLPICAAITTPARRLAQALRPRAARTANTRWPRPRASATLPGTAPRTGVPNGMRWCRRRAPRTRLGRRRAFGATPSCRSRGRPSRPRRSRRRRSRSWRRKRKRRKRAPSRSSRQQRPPTTAATTRTTRSTMLTRTRKRMRTSKPKSGATHASKRTSLTSPWIWWATTFPRRRTLGLASCGAPVSRVASTFRFSGSVQAAARRAIAISLV
mmetsp:Transcript_127986/g.368761  ORF Transcript_127986/g.368761 Transcript_127986/m.368761 type:complete len:305 (+) Transcript_127986:410-1324(+)